MPKMCRYDVTGKDVTCRMNDICQSPFYVPSKTFVRNRINHQPIHRQGTNTLSKQSTYPSETGLKTGLLKD